VPADRASRLAAFGGRLDATTASYRKNAMKDAAICFAGENEGLGSSFYGRLAANTGLLQAWARYGSGDVLRCVSPSTDEARKLLELLHGAGLNQRPLVRVASFARSLPNENIGALFRLDPNLSDMMWARRVEGTERRFSICGLTHTLSPNAVIDWMGSLTVNPAQPWDALICTSRAARSMISDLFEQWREYLGERLGATRGCPIQLPVIPLGVETSSYGPDPAARAQFRAKLGLGEEDVAVLFMGRLSYFEKAHPSPMFIAAEMAQAQMKGRGRLHLLLVGRFPDAGDETLYRNCAAALAPSIPLHVLNGADNETYAGARVGADIFLSLSDNVQETFGLTPVEAMACGLPAVVSDWDGYRDTIDDGVTGLRIPTVMAPPGSGEGIGSYHYQSRDYYRFLGRVSQRTAVDLSAAAAALAGLADDPARRRAMGAAGRERARRVYDWSVVIGRYEALWAELRAQREAAPPPVVTLTPPAPEPFRLFGSFATGAPDDRWTLTLLTGWRPRLDAVLADPLSHMHAPVPDDKTTLATILAGFDGRAVVLGDVLGAYPTGMRSGLLHLLIWLMKMGILTLTPPAGTSPTGGLQPAPVK
jgi:glycosyltransferase involved in cell wall biosynthesis